MADVQGCQPSQFLDRTAASADRELAWDFGIGSDPERCIQIKTGQSVFWNGVSDNHPLGGSGGDQPNPISLHHDGVVTFSQPGTFGFVCLNHSSMKGAIQVIQAPPTPGPAVPAPIVTPTLTIALTFVLLLSGLVVITSRRGKLLQTRR